jgi:hypothetical protein
MEKEAVSELPKRPLTQGMMAGGIPSFHNALHTAWPGERRNLMLRRAILHDGRGRLRIVNNPRTEFR